jgi:hypothetical protein
VVSFDSVAGRSSLILSVFGFIPIKESTGRRIQCWVRSSSLRDISFAFVVTLIVLSFSYVKKVFEISNKHHEHPTPFLHWPSRAHLILRKSILNAEMYPDKVHVVCVGIMPSCGKTFQMFFVIQVKFGEQIKIYLT